MAEVSVMLDDARAGRLPGVCAISGEAAGGAAPMKLERRLRTPTAPTIRVPLSDAVFQKWARRQNIHIKARWVAASLTAVAVAIAFRNGPLAVAVLALAVAIHLVDLWAERTSDQLRPGVRRNHDEVVLTGVHPRFVEAVEARRARS